MNDAGNHDQGEIFGATWQLELNVSEEISSILDGIFCFSVWL